MRSGREVLEVLAGREPRSTLAMAAWSTASSPRHVRVLRAGSSLCLLVRSEPMVWLGFPQLLDRADSRGLAAVIDASSAVGLDGHPEDVEPLLAHLHRLGEVGRFRRIVVPREQCVWTASDDSTRMATMIDLPQVIDLFADYEVRFVGSDRHRAANLQGAVRRHGVVVHDGPDGIDAAGVTGGLTPGYLVLEHLRVAEHARGYGHSWRIVSRIVEIAQSYGVGIMSTLVDENPMTLPQDRGRVELQVSVNLSLRDRLPGERLIRRQVLRASRAGVFNRPQEAVLSSGSHRHRYFACTTS